MPETICLAFTGASGMPYGVRLLECLLAADCRVQLLYSQVAQIVARQEMALDLPARASDAQAALRERYRALPGRLEVYGREEWFAPVASGSNPPDAMVVCPCSMGTLAAIAQGLASKLIERAADVVLKENRKLILVPRETPLSAIHLENMLRLVRAGAVVLPPNPGFYHHPQRVEDTGDDEFDHFGNGLRAVVETRAGRQDDRAGPGQAQHVLEMDGGQRRLAWNQDQLAAFLENHVGGALDQVVGQPLGDSGQCAHRAGTDDHRVRRVGARGDRGEPLLAPENNQLFRVDRRIPGEQGGPGFGRA